MRRSYFGGTGEPWFYLAGIPFGSCLLVILVQAISAVVNTVATGLLGRGRVLGLAMIPREVFSGRIWQVFTWPLFNFVGFWYVVSLFFLFIFGKEIETLLGRNGFLKFYLWLAAAMTAFALLIDAPLAGASDLNFAVFLAFAITSPGAVLWCRIGLTAKWAAIILIAIDALQYIAARAWGQLAVLAVMIAATAVILRMMGAAHSLPWLRVPDLSAVPRIRFRQAPRPPRLTVVSDPMPEIDILLDKIATSGVDSLTAKEKATLQAASDRAKRRK